MATDFVAGIKAAVTALREGAIQHADNLLSDLLKAQPPPAAPTARPAAAAKPAAAPTPAPAAAAPAPAIAAAATSGAVGNLVVSLLSGIVSHLGFPPALQALLDELLTGIEAEL